MIKKIVLSVVLLLACQAVFSQEKTAVDYRAEQTKLVKMGDSSVVKLIGDVFLFHNGAIIYCDSAYRYSEKRFEAFGKVIINQDSLYIYGDKVVYNGETDVARIYSDLIKAVDSSAVMYTRQMYFNTKDKIGYFSEGATMEQNGSLLEAESGTYNTSTKLLTLDNRVAMENDEYILKTNALRYNQNTEIAYFNTYTNIWNIKGEYLEADEGNYEKNSKIYNLEKNSYILTKEQECWSDSLKYFSFENEVELRRNIQINDTVQRASSFGDYGYFWNKNKSVLMTINPSMFSYDEQKSDTTYVRADTITIKPIIDRTNLHSKSDEMMGPMGILDSLKGTDSLKIAVRDSLMMAKSADTIKTVPSIIENLNITDNLADSITAIKKQEVDSVGSEITSLSKDITEPQKEVEEDGKLSEADSLSNSLRIPVYRELYDEAQLATMSEKEKKIARKIMQRDRKRFDREVKRYIKENEIIEKIDREKAIVDSLANAAKVDTSANRVDENSEIIDIKNTPDSGDMIVRAYGNSKIYKVDLQSVADTMIVESVDSTMTSIGTPVAWNDNNQITAGRIRTYILNGQMSRSRLFDKPIVAQFVGENQYNQMSGDYMDALYKNNELYKLIVTADAKTRFYRQEQDTETGDVDVVAFITSTSTNMIIDFDSSLVSRIKWVGATETYTYPMNMIPEETRYLEGFKWVPELRPLKKDVFNRIIRASVRREKEAIAKPDFGITRSIFEERKRLLNLGVWSDRNERLKIDRNELFKQSLEER